MMRTWFNRKLRGTTQESYIDAREALETAGKARAALMRARTQRQPDRPPVQAEPDRPRRRLHAEEEHE